MKKIAMIPARYAATRFPGKLMQKLGDKTVIRRVYEATLQTGLFDDVIIVTDSDNNNLAQTQESQVKSYEEVHCKTKSRHDPT